MTSFWYGVRPPQTAHFYYEPINDTWTRPDYIEFQNLLALNPATDNTFLTTSPFGTSSFSVSPAGIYHYEPFTPRFNRYFLRTPNGYGQGVEISTERHFTYQPVLHWQTPPTQEIEEDPFYMEDDEFDEWLAAHPPPPDPVDL